MGIQRRRGNGFLARFVQVRIQLLSFFSDRRIDTTTIFLWSSNIVSLSSVNMKYNVNTVIKNSKSSGFHSYLISFRARWGHATEDTWGPWSACNACLHSGLPW